MNNWVPFLAIFLLGFTPIYDKYDDEKVTDEIKNMEVQLQDKQFRILDSTPVLVDLQDREIVVISTNGIEGLIYRRGIDLFLVTGSCITVKRGE